MFRHVISILFYTNLLLFLLSIYYFNESGGAYEGSISLGLIGICIFYFAKILRSILKKSPPIQYFFSFTSIMMAFSIYMRYFHWKVWDVPGFIIVPAFFIVAGIYIRNQIKLNQIDLKSFFTVFAFIGLLIPMIMDIENGPRKLIPDEYLPQSILSERKRNDKWVWYVSEETGNGKWIPLKDQTNVEDGSYTAFFHNGKIREKGRVENNKKIDTVFLFDLNEKLIKHVVFSKDTAIAYFENDGNYSDYYSSGELFETGVIKGHKIADPWTSYYKTGIISLKLYKMGEILIREEYYESGQLKGIGRSKNEKQEGETCLYYENGQIKVVCEWKNGKQHGKRITYYQDGKVETSDHFNNGLQEGESLIYYENGNMKQRRFFKNGEPNGIVTDWYENSAKKTVTIYLGEKKNGVSNRYYENGNLKQKIQYRNDMANGLVNFYDSLGNIQSSFVYKNGEVEKTLFRK
jgi:antitoxin component YwqK of YwqJK toxin-antitoxin module